METITLPSYVAAARVRAAPILNALPTRYGRSRVEVLVDGRRHDLPVADSYFFRGVPRPGDYHVVHEDGFEEWVAKASFVRRYAESVAVPVAA